MGKSKKTNAMRILDSHKVDYMVYEYEVVDGKTDGLTVAKSVGMDPKIVFKTLVTVGTSKEMYVFVIPVGQELDLKKAARAAGEKKIEMIPQKDLLKNTGYVHGGCSPLGMKKAFKTFLHDSALENERIVCSGGRVGMQVDLLVKELVPIVECEICSLIK